MRRMLLAALLIVSCSPADEAAPPSPSTTQQTTTTTVPPTTIMTTMPPSTTVPAPTAFGISSAGFEDGDSMPRDYTCDGADVSPPLSIDGIPTGTDTLAIVFDDPDAPLGTWDHWVEFNILVDSTSLELERGTEQVGVQGVNGWNLSGYMGPCPPAGETHEYVLTVYALDATLDLQPGIESTRLYDAMEDHVIATVVLTATYGR